MRYLYNMEPTLISPSSGKTFSIMGGRYRIVISGKDTNHEYAVIEMTVPPGGGPNPHAHKDFHESFHVLEGEVIFTTANGSVTAGAGNTIVIPKGGAVHSFKNKSDKVARLWCTVVPAGLDAFFEEFETTNGDKSKIAALSEKYGQVLLPADYWEK